MVRYHIGEPGDLRQDRLSCPIDQRIRVVVFPLSGSFQLQGIT